MESGKIFNTSLTPEERFDKRKITEYQDWIKNVFERDNYTCRKLEEITIECDMSLRQKALEILDSGGYDKILRTGPKLGKNETKVDINTYQVIATKILND
jgi:hypothetical protein